MCFDFEIVHKPGAYNIADYLSRHPMEDNTVIDDEDAIESHVYFISGHAIPKSMTRDEIVECTNNDSVLPKLRQIIQGEVRFGDNEFTKSIERDFGRVFGELSVTEDGLVMRGERLVLPEKLQSRALKIAHEGHQGKTKTKSLLRTKVWFPKMDNMVEQMVQDCLACQLEGGGSSPQPLQMSKLSKVPWVNLAMDFYGPLPNGKELMVVMDETSKNPYFEEVKSTASEHVCPMLEKLFAFVGVPKVLKTDNGPPFNGQKFKDFLESYGVVHQKVTPEHPQANGQVENFMKNVGRVIRTVKAENKDWRQQLNLFAMSYRSTPHSTTGVPPSVLLFGVNRTNRLPTIVNEYKPTVEMETACERDLKVKSKAKAYADHKRKAKAHSFVVDDRVLFRQHQTNKTMPKFSSEGHTITAIKGSMVSVKADGGKEFTRDASKFKLESKGRLEGSRSFDWLEGESDKQVTTDTTDTTATTPVATTPSNPTSELRRSERQRNPVQRYGQPVS